MERKWIMDVLLDLRGFAQANGLVELAEQLEKASHVATTELPIRGERQLGGVSTEEKNIGYDRERDRCGT